MKLSAYPKYKPSGVEWLGDVPEHWEVKTLRRVLAESLKYGANESAELDDPDLPRYVRITDVHENGSLRDETFRSLPKDVAAPYLLEDGDLLFARSGATSGKTFLYQNSWGICAYAGYLIRARMNRKQVVPAFVKYFTTSTCYWQWLSSIFIQSTIQNVSAEKYADLRLSLPPLTEQQAIAAYLDRETGRLDRLVGRKRELIKRLKEKRTALISRTVTRGLPSAAARAAGLPENPPLKPSGVPWFDECPSHWQTKRLRHISDFIVVGVVVNPSSYVTDEGVVFLLGGDVREMRIDTTDCKRCSPESSDGPLVKSRLDAGDLVVVRVGYPGVAAVVPPELAGGNVASMMLVRRHPRYCSQWLAYAFNSQVGRDQVEIVQYGAAQKQFNISHAVDFAFPFPPLPEQAAIAAYLDEETAKLDALVGKVEAAVERLQEYRTALITAAVTGKIDVRSFSSGTESLDR